jgi:hypothetical protein
MVTFYAQSDQRPGEPNVKPAKRREAVIRSDPASRMYLRGSLLGHRPRPSQNPRRSPEQIWARSESGKLKPIGRVSKRNFPGPWAANQDIQESPASSVPDWSNHAEAGIGRYWRLSGGRSRTRVQSGEVNNRVHT